MDLVLRNENEADYREVEELTREAFWNLHVPGCDEHFLAHVMREHPDFIPALDFVAVLGGRIVGNIMYCRSRLLSEDGSSMDTVTFGPVSVRPELQKQGIGSRLIRHSMVAARQAGEQAVIIEGHPHNYCKHGFIGSKSLDVSDSHGMFPYSLMVNELKPGCLAGKSWRFQPSNVYEIDEEMARKFDTHFLPKAKEFQPSQEEFNIASRAFVL